MRTETARPSPSFTERQRARDTARQIEVFRLSVESVVRPGTAAEELWDEYRTQVQRIERQLNALAEDETDLDLELDLVELSEQWMLLREPLTEIVDAVMEDETELLRLRHERAVERIQAVKQNLRRSVRNGFDALSQSLSSLTEPRH